MILLEKKERRTTWATGKGLPYGAGKLLAEPDFNQYSPDKRRGSMISSTLIAQICNMVKTVYLINEIKN